MRESIKVGAKEMNRAVQPLVSGRGASEFYTQANHVLVRTSAYNALLVQANAVSFDQASINAGFIAGLRAAAELANINYEFLIER